MNELDFPGLAVAALDDAVKSRRPERGFIFHTDRGSQYAPSDFRNAVARSGGLQSMSGPGNHYDNACAETFFRSLNVERPDAAHFATRYQDAEAIAEYLPFNNGCKSIPHLTIAPLRTSSAALRACLPLRGALG